MSLDVDILKYGAKGANLNYIKNNVSNVPIEPYVLVPVGENWKKYESEIKRLGDSWVRSSSPLEDGKKVSFAGLFATEWFDGQKSVDSVLHSVNSENALKYAKIHGIKSPLEMGLVFHKDSDAEWNWGMARHPHKENLIFIMGRNKNNQRGFSNNYIYDENIGKLQYIDNFIESTLLVNSNPEFENLEEGLEEALEVYRQAENLPEYKKTNFVYHMEFGTKPFSVYQFRPFKEKQKADWELSFDKLNEEFGMENYLHEFSLSFGITGPEGIDLKTVQGLSPHYHMKEIRSVGDELKNKSEEEVINNLSETWKLNSIERAYAEEIIKLPNNHDLAFDNALEKISSQIQDDKNCLFQHNLHAYFGKGADLVFPNAKVWIPFGGMDFLSHDWFRAVQEYDITLMGNNYLHGRTGDQVKIFSDGVFGVAVEPYNFKFD